MIVSIRGTHGSGKSTIVKKIIDKWLKPIKPDAKGRCEGYRGALPNGHTLAVIGSYHNACGGCDGIQPYARILDYIRGYARDFDHVLLEGALVSSSYGSVGVLMDQYVDAGGAVFAFLDTPLETALDRIRLRREAKGNFEPVNPKNTAVKHENVHRTKQQLIKLGSRISVVDLDHTRPVTQLMKLYGVTLRKEP